MVCGFVLKRDWDICQNLLTILGSILNINGGGDLYDHLMRSRICTYDYDKDIHMSSENYEATGYRHNLDWQSSCINCVFHILVEVSA